MTDRDPADQQAPREWRAGETFFAESGGRPAEAPEGEPRAGAHGAGEADGHLPASESGTGIIPEDGESPAEDVHLPASEADSGALQGEGEGEPQSWPGRGGPGSFPPPG